MVTEVPVYTTEYHFRKFVQTRTKTYTPGTPAVKAQHYSLAGGSWKSGEFPAFPDPGAPFKWVANTHHEPHGTKNVTYVDGPGNRHYTSKNGNTNWFAFVPGTPATEGSWGEWSAWSAWTPWEPEQHESWEDSPEPLGTPQPHGSGRDGNVKWERQWQAQHDGETRQVQTGTTTETTFGDWGPWTAYGNNPYLSEPAVPANTDTDEYRVSGPVTVTDKEGTSEQVTFYAWTDGKVCETPTETPTTPTETPTVPTETPTVTPETPTETPTESVPTETPTVNPETPEQEQTPEPDKDKDEPVKPPRSTPQPPKNVQVIACVDGVWTTTVNGEVISESGSCEVTPENSVPQTFSETGL
jgi:hypothetical protein